MANNLQKMFVIVPATKGEAFKTAHTGASKDSSDNYYDKIAFLVDTGEICTHGKVYAKNADLLSADENTPGSVPNQVRTAVNDIISTYLEGEGLQDTLDTLQEVIDWINGHEGVDGNPATYLLQDVEALNTIVKGSPTYYHTVEEYNAGHAQDENWVDISEEDFNALPKQQKIKDAANTANGLQARVAVLESTEANRDQSSNITVNSANNVISLTIDQNVDGKLDENESSMTVATESLHNVVGMQYNSQNGTWSAPQNSTVSNANALAVASDVAAELVADEQVIATALNAHESRLDVLEGDESETGSVDQKIAAMKATLDANVDSTGAATVRVNVVEVDGVITAVTTAIDVATVTGTRYNKTSSTNPNIVADQNTYFLTGQDIATIKDYVDDKATQLFDNSIDSLDVPSTAVNNTQNGVNYTSFTYSETDGLVSITGLSNAIGVVSESNDTMVVTTDGLIDARALVTTLNAIDPWFTYPEN